MIKTIILSVVMIYFGIATFILINLLFNKHFKLTIVDYETKEKYDPKGWYYMYLSISWLVILIRIFIDLRKNKKRRKI